MILTREGVGAEGGRETSKVEDGKGKEDTGATYSREKKKKGADAQHGGRKTYKTVRRSGGEGMTGERSTKVVGTKCELTLMEVEGSLEEEIRNKRQRGLEISVEAELEHPQYAGLTIQPCRSQ